MSIRTLITLVFVLLYTNPVFSSQLSMQFNYAYQLLDTGASPLTTMSLCQADSTIFGAQQTNVNQYNEYTIITNYMLLGCGISGCIMLIIFFVNVFYHTRVWKHTYMHGALIVIIFFPIIYAYVYTMRLWRGDPYENSSFLLQMYNLILLAAFYVYTYEFVNFDARTRTYTDNLLMLWAHNTTHLKIKNEPYERGDRLPMDFSVAEKEVNSLYRTITVFASIYAFLCFTGNVFSFNLIVSVILVSLEVLTIIMANQKFAGLVKRGQAQYETVCSKLAFMNTCWGSIGITNVTVLLLEIFASKLGLNFLNQMDQVQFLRNCESCFIILIVLGASFASWCIFSSQTFIYYEHENGAALREAMSQSYLRSTELTYVDPITHSHKHATTSTASSSPVTEKRKGRDVTLHVKDGTKSSGNRTSQSPEVSPSSTNRSHKKKPKKEEDTNY